MKLTLLRLSLLGGLMLSFGYADEGSDKDVVPGSPEPPARVRSDSEAMQEAIAEARTTVGGFIEALQRGDGTKFSVKTAVKDGDKVEHLWLGELRYRNGKFIGKIGNKPHVVKSVSFGDSYTVRKQEISDWAYFKGNEVQGGFTAKVLMTKKGAVAEPAVEGGEDPLILGRWKVLATDSGAGPQLRGNFFLEISKDSLTLIAPGSEKQLMGKIKGIDSKTKPQRIDITREGEVGLGVYEIGDGTMLLLIRNPGQPRAIEFKGAPEGMMFMLERE